MRLTLILLIATAAQNCSGWGIYTVAPAPAGNDETGNGSPAKPWATVAAAVEKIPDDGSTILVKDGVYDGRIRLNRRFQRPTLIQAEHDYRAVLEHSAGGAVISIYGGTRLEVSGFEIRRTPEAAAFPLVIHIQAGDNGPPEEIVLRNNIIHDSYNNDLVKINNGARGIIVENNVFYNQNGYDEHIDVNGVVDVTIRGNIFFNDFEGSGRRNASDTGSFLVVKNSGDLPENRRIVIAGNILLNWQGAGGAGFITIGEDGKPNFEAEDVVVENNLFVGNSPFRMRAPLIIQGARQVLVRHNTFTGNLPARGYGFTVWRAGANPRSQGIRFLQNIWSDGTGTMDGWGTTSGAETGQLRLRGNLYWNGLRPLPEDAAEVVDARPVTKDPKLPRVGEVVLPRWQGTKFLSGSQTAREEFERLVREFGVPGAGSAAFRGGDITDAPPIDILGQSRKGNVDLGCVQVSPPGPAAK